MISQQHTGVRIPLLAAAAGFCVLAGQVAAEAPNRADAATPTYADLADLADSSRLVVRAEVRKLALVEPERARGVRPGYARYYVEARTKALLAGNTPIGEDLRYLADLPLDSRGKPPAIKKKPVLLFVREARGAPAQLQLVAPDAQVFWSPETESRTRAILAELLSPTAAPRITGVREAIYVPGTLAGEGETQFFLDTTKQSAASITVQHRPDAPPGAPPLWGVSFSEVAAAPDDRPQPNTLAWYRLACFLPNSVPVSASLSDTATNRAQAQADYRTVLGELGPCARNR